MEQTSGTDSNVFLEVSDLSDKFIVVYTLLKLELITGKIVIFVNNKASGYKLKIFLEEFSIKNALLNYELPKATRHLAVTNFTKGVNVLIVIDPEEKGSNTKDTKRHKIFKVPVSVLMNFGMPSSSKLFKKRIADMSSEINAGMSILTLVSSEEQELETFNKISKRMEKQGRPFEKLQLKMEQFEKFRYRCEDVLRGVTEKRIKAFQINDVKKAILAIKDSKNKLELNPEDKKILADAKKKEKPLKHLASVPDYLLPDSMRKNSKPYMVNKKDFEVKLAKRQRRDPKNFAEDEYMEEAPENIAWQDLTPTSNRKLWKIRHRHSLAKKVKAPRRY